MKSYRLLLTFVLVFSFQKVYVQSHFDIVFPRSANERNQKCKSCFETFKNKPKGVKFSIKRDGNNLYFEVNDKDWFNKLFATEGDGMAIDLVTKSKYDCSIDSIENKQIRGRLMRPLYGSLLRKA
ncbi:hypothetical protein [Pseudotamlana carrageenivorans]|uniref:Uncharacterized protein n=1 Tax=Pseudotamlana carrageenivorans TaxID=2069432 RepID=A0A2I7SFQ3_9FLAO|nr:hypothetical protein [Tamlana carrageenivorans]AUS04742.1 hypothetical protein C1A40_04300 [Tamlana carrageenivorans]